jgi:hypothetical protein
LAEISWFKSSVLLGFVASTDISFIAGQAARNDIDFGTGPNTQATTNLRALWDHIVRFQRAVLDCYVAVQESGNMLTPNAVLPLIVQVVTVIVLLT